MGMFDYLRCERPLPGLEDPTAIEFQTKDTDAQYLEKYTIRADGRLIHRRPTRYEDHSDPNATGLMKLRGCMTPVDFVDEDTNFHGVLNFYGDKHTGELIALNLATGEDELHPVPAPEWFEYNAKFTDGNLVEVKRVGEPCPKRERPA